LTTLPVTSSKAQVTSSTDITVPVIRAYGPGGPASADLVITETENTIYRSCGIAITTRSERKALAKEFADFVQSAEGREIFKRWGWIAP
jgi:accessory colonization factor AcfC